MVVTKVQRTGRGATLPPGEISVVATGGPTRRSERDSVLAGAALISERGNKKVLEVP